MKNFLFFFILIFFNTSFANNIKEKEISVRIKMSSAAIVKVSGLNLTRTFILTGEAKTFKGNKSIRFFCKKFLNKNKISKKPFLIATISSSQNILVINKYRYNGIAYLLANPSKKNCDIILKTQFEGYLSSVLAKEMNAKWPIEALKAQAVAARTYALYKMKKNVNNPFDMEGSEKDQVIGHLLDKTIKTDKAVMETEGEVLLNKNKNIIPAFFHAECGGRLVRPREVWDNHIKGFNHKKDIFCKKRKNRFKWNFTLSNKKYFKFLNWLVRTGRIRINGIVAHSTMSKDYLSRSFIKVLVNSKKIKIKKAWLRVYLGRFKIRSNTFVMKIGKKKLYIYGFGRGHGVGLCQLGALEMARRGYHYKEILKYYFSSFQVNNLYLK